VGLIKHETEMPKLNFLIIIQEILRFCAFPKNLFVIKPTRRTNFANLFWHETLHVSDSSPVHRQEFIHCTLSNGTCRTSL
jgi:hypothetical protein